MAYVALTLGLLLAFLVALLSVPLTIVFSIHRVEEMQGTVRFQWLFGLVRFRVRIPRTEGAAPGSPPARKKPTKQRRRKRRKAGAGKMLRLIRQPAPRRRIGRFIRDIWRATHAGDLLLRLRIGLGDPADTGCLWAVLGPIAGMVQNVQGAVVRIEPEFVDPVFEIESRGRFRLLPVQFMALTLAFLLSPVMLRTWWRLRRGGA